ncbi:hypothetical protein D3C72_2320830 [compost metagenome]
MKVPIGTLASSVRLEVPRAVFLAMPKSSSLTWPVCCVRMMLLGLMSRCTIPRA